MATKVSGLFNNANDLFNKEKQILNATYSKIILSLLCFLFFIRNVNDF